MILLVDDEERYIRGYIEAIKEAELPLQYCREVDEALKFLAEHLHEVRLIILDVMMPPGNSFETVYTDAGRRTGLRVYERIRQMTRYLPVMVLTNVTDSEIARTFRKDEQCWFGNKKNYKPEAFLFEVRRMIDSWPTVG